MLYLAVALIFLCIWVFVGSLLFSFFCKEKAIDKLKYFEADYELKEKFEGHKKNKVSLLKNISKALPFVKLSLKGSKKLEIELIKADMPITVEELLVIKHISSTAIAALTYLLFRNNGITLIVYFFIWNIPKLIISKRKKERLKEFDGQLTEGIMIISNALKAGYSFLQAVAAVVEETKDPFSKEFKKLFKEMSLGIAEEDALRNMLLRMTSGDLKLIVNAILIQKDIGGNLSEILDNIGETIRERQKIQDELKTLTAQGRLSGIIVMLIPIVLGLTIYLFNKEYILLLFNTPLGILMISVSVFNQILGLVMIRKIINIDM
ncbi:MAG: type II secretion system F family protein [Clostridiaceae bacterium]|nr:type II secretion system F family protein [Clostridiaceae bacterium]